MKIILITALLMLSFTVSAVPHKCVINGKTSYTEKQCPSPENEKKIDKGGFGVLDTSGQRQQWAEKEEKAINDKSNQAQKDREALIKDLIAKSQDFPSTSLPLDEYNKKMNERNAAKKLLDSLLGVSTAKVADTPKKCSSDYSCGVGFSCVKAPYQGTGECMKAFDQNGAPQYTKDPNSILPNMSMEGCFAVGSGCPSGFHCDIKLKACVK